MKLLSYQNNNHCKHYQIINLVKFSMKKNFCPITIHIYSFSIFYIYTPFWFSNFRTITHILQWKRVYICNKIYSMVDNFYYPPWTYNFLNVQFLRINCEHATLVELYMQRNSCFSIPIVVLCTSTKNLEESSDWRLFISQQEKGKSTGISCFFLFYPYISFWGQKGWKS